MIRTLLLITDLSKQGYMIDERWLSDPVLYAVVSTTF